MKKERGKKIKLREMILPNQKLNYFVGTIILLGILSGSIFLILSNSTDKNNVIKQLKYFLRILVKII